MARFWRGFAAVLAVGLVAALQPAAAATISGLANTGSGGGADGTADPFYDVVGPAPYNTPQDAIITSPHPNWVAEPLGSQWIGVVGSHNTTVPAGLYTFSISFDLTGFVPSTATIGGSIAADNSAVISLNGTSTGLGAAGFGSLTAFSIFDGINGANFVAGLNTITIAVTQGTGSGGNPMGLLIADLSTSVNPVPLPAALPLFVAGLGVWGWASRRRRSAAAPA